MSSYGKTQEDRQESSGKNLQVRVEKLELLGKITGSQASILRQHLPALMKICSNLKYVDEYGELGAIRAAIKANMIALERMLGREQALETIEDALDYEKEVTKLEESLEDYIQSFEDFLEDFEESEEKNIQFAVIHIRNVERQKAIERRWWDELDRKIKRMVKVSPVVSHSKKSESDWEILDSPDELDLEEFEKEASEKEAEPEQEDTVEKSAEAEHAVSKDAAEKETEPEEEVQKDAEKIAAGTKEEPVQKTDAKEPEKENAAEKKRDAEIRKKTEEFYRGYKYLPPEVQEKLKSTDIKVLQEINTTAHPMLKEYIELRIAALKKLQVSEKEEKKPEQNPEVQTGKKLEKSQEVQTGKKLEKSPEVQTAKKLEKSPEVQTAKKSEEKRKAKVKQYEKPSMLCSLANLQTLNYLCGGKFYPVKDNMDPDHPRIIASESIDDRDVNGVYEKIAQKEIIALSKAKNLKIITRKMAETIRELNPDKLNQILGKYDLSEEELEIAQKRLEKLKQRIESGEKDPRTLREKINAEGELCNEKDAIHIMKADEWKDLKLENLMPTSKVLSRKMDRAMTRVLDGKNYF